MEISFFPSGEAAMNAVLRAAAETRASDIHIEPMKDYVRVRFRRDGLLSEFLRLPSAMAEKLAVRVKVIGRMNVAETRTPQDGSAPFSAGGAEYDLRISVLPSLYGETIVVRLLSGELPFIEKNELGMLPAQEDIFLSALRGRRGMLLVTGPTGAGKTSTLYAALRIANCPTASVISIEDPVEYRIPGVTQVSVNDRAGLTFASGLRALVRQDPDVVMVGEIRDRETAEIAVHAALTGHLVLSSLHTNRAADAPLRLADMGIPPYLLAASLSLIISQRLVRTLCAHCKEETKISAADAAALGLSAGETVYAARGCEACGREGHAGRTGIFEMLRVTGEAAEAIRSEKPPAVLAGLMREAGSADFRAAAREAVRAGRISVETAMELIANAEG